MANPPQKRGGSRPGAGRPPQMVDAVKVALDLPAATLAKIDARAARSGGTRAAVMRELLERGLRARRR